MNEALLIKQLLTHIANAQFCADAVILDMNLKGGAKDKFNRIKNYLLGAEREISLSLSPKHSQAIREEVMQNWESLSFHNINYMVMAMDDDQRRMVEEYCSQIITHNDTTTSS